MLATALVINLLIIIQRGSFHIGKGASPYNTSRSMRLAQFFGNTVRRVSRKVAKAALGTFRQRI